MTKIRQQLEKLNEQCMQLCEEEGWQSPKGKNPNYRLIYTSVETFERGNGFAIVGINPAGTKLDADRDNDRGTPFTNKEYSAYLDDDWEGGRGQSPFQRAVQGIAMILTGSTAPEAIAAICREGIAPEQRIGDDATAFLRQTPSLNIIPFRSPTANRLPFQLRQSGEQFGWELLCLAKPKPRYIITLANSISDYPWRTILEKSEQPPQAEYQELLSPRKPSRGVRNYREVNLVRGPINGALLFGLPAVVHDKISDDKVREEVTMPMFETLRKRLQYHGVIN